MDLPISLQDITYAENYLAQGDLATATPLLERLVELAEEYIDAECKTEEKRQYFSFDSKFERLAYRRVEKDPRELVQVEVPFDRLYSDMAFAYIRQQDYVSARNALMQAVRWDPMNCNYRLDLAELFRALEDKQEWASLSFSVLERASDGKCAAALTPIWDSTSWSPRPRTFRLPWAARVWRCAWRPTIRIRRACSTRSILPIRMPPRRATST